MDIFAAMNGVTESDRINEKQLKHQHL